ncbi:MAG: hypothetical protein QW594_03075, partial [Candidatus Woesearchaeota archaeon]
WNEKKRRKEEIEHVWKKNNIHVDINDAALYTWLLLEKIEEQRSKKPTLAPLTYDLLYEIGKYLTPYFFPGLPEAFAHLKKIPQQHPEWKKEGIEVQVIAISAGLGPLLRGSGLGAVIDKIYACEFLTNQEGIITSCIAPLSDTEKTRYYFKTKKEPYEVNDKIPPSVLQAKPEHMIVLGDGPTDIPLFSTAQQQGAICLAVYESENTKSLHKAITLRQQDRIFNFFEADYRPKSSLMQFITYSIEQFCENIVKNKKRSYDELVKKAVSLRDE